MESKINSVIEKINKLLKLSSSSNAHEAATAAAMANRLIDQYRLSEEDLNVSENEDPIVEDQQYIYETGKVTPWKQDLVRILAKHYGCAQWLDNHFPSGRKVTRHRLVGKKSDIHITKYMFNWLVLECQRLAEKEAKGAGRVFIASYCHGFVSGVAQQLISSRADAQKNASETSIVKVDARAEASRSFMYNNHPNLRSVKASNNSQINSTAFGIGMERGKNVHLGSSMASGKGTKLLGN